MILFGILMFFAGCVVKTLIPMPGIDDQVRGLWAKLWAKIR